MIPINTQNWICLGWSDKIDVNGKAMEQLLNARQWLHDYMDFTALLI